MRGGLGSDFSPSQVSRVHQMTVNALRIGRLEQIDRQICLTLAQCSVSTIRPCITHELATAIGCALENCEDQPTLRWESSPGIMSGTSGSRHEQAAKGVRVGANVAPFRDLCLFRYCGCWNGWPKRAEWRDEDAPCQLAARC